MIGHAVEDFRRRQSPARQLAQEVLGDATRRATAPAFKRSFSIMLLPSHQVQTLSSRLAPPFVCVAFLDCRRGTFPAG